jgi:hypothetical protein
MNTSNDGNFSIELWDVPLLVVNNVMVMVLLGSHNNCYVHGRTSEFNIQLQYGDSRFWNSSAAEAGGCSLS